MQHNEPNNNPEQQPAGKIARKRLLLTIVIAVPFVLLVLWLWWGSDSHSLSTPEQHDPQVIDKDKFQKLNEKAKAIEEAKTSRDEKKVAEAEQSFLDVLGGRAAKMARMAMARNLTIEMYGKVIDQYGQPVANAVVHLMIAGGGTMAPGSGPVEVTTNEEGMFQLRASGQEISVISIRHPKLATALYRTRWGNVDTGAERLFAVKNNGEKYSWRSYTTPDKPFVINVWRVDKFEKIKYGGGGFVPVPNGKKFEHAGIEVSCERDPKEPAVHWRDQKGSWSITFRPIDGGIQETDDIYLNEAPESGYQPELTVAMQRDTPDYKVNIQTARRYYYTAYSGKWYGSFSATFDPYMYDDECRVMADIKYNPNGSRNLAVKPRY